MKTKILAPYQFIFPSKPENLATGLLYASLHFQTCSILTVLSLQMLVISVHVSFLHLVDKICDFTVAMIYKILIAFVTCVVIRSLCLL